MTAAPPGRIRSVQALRAIAALFVVVNHTTLLWRYKFDGGAVEWANGNAGVDLFFVISGFIMVVSSRRLRSRADGWLRFAQLRLIRIVPLYWGLTGLKLATILAVPATALHTRPTAWNVAASFLFIPSRDASHDIRPVLPVGWTLSYEMLFYFVFAVALLAGVDALVLVGPVMGALALLSALRTDGVPAIFTLADPIVLEFVLGVVVARLFVSGPVARAGSAWGLLPIVAGMLCLGLVPADTSLQRVLVWGIPAAVVLASAVRAEHWLDRFVPAAVVWLGEASYSLYLVHGFVIPVVGWAFLRAGLAGWGQGAFIIASIAASIAASLALFTWVEAPMTARLRRMTKADASTHARAPRAAQDAAQGAGMRPLR